MRGAVRHIYFRLLKLIDPNFEGVLKQTLTDGGEESVGLHQRVHSLQRERMVLLQELEAAKKEISIARDRIYELMTGGTIKVGSIESGSRTDLPSQRERLRRIESAMGLPEGAGEIPLDD